ncbi:MAG: DUF924 family protein [Myxococcota bacterium]
MSKAEAEDVLDFWFGQLDADGRAEASKRKSWWKKDPAFDEEIRDRFLATYEAIVAGERRAWQEHASSCLALVIVLDQFSRNMFRNTAKMYAADGQSVQIVHSGLERGFDRMLRTDECVFFYMPLMHSEDLAHQERCIVLFRALHDQCPVAAKDGLAKNIDFAVKHRDIVRDWGRFPHRNEILGRASTPEELAFLEQPGSGF